LTATDREKLEKELLSFIMAEFAATGEVTRDTPLIRQGVVDSIGILRLVRFLEDHAHVRVEAQDLVLENFASVKATVDFVERRQNAG
jgi:acyl carrier protein